MLKGVKQSDNLDGCIINFKRSFTACEVSMLRTSDYIQNVTSIIPELDIDLLPLGQINTKEKSFYMFPNCHIHKLNKIINKSKKKWVSTYHCILLN